MLFKGRTETITPILRQITPRFSGPGVDEHFKIRQLEKIEYLVVTDGGLAENLIALGLVPSHQIEKLGSENRADHIAILDFLFSSAGSPT